MVHVPLTFLSEWCEFSLSPSLRGGGVLITARVSMLLKSRASLDMLPFSLCNKKRLAIRHIKRHPFLPKTLSIPSNDIGLFMILRSRLRSFGLCNIPAIRPFSTWLHVYESVGIFSLDDSRTLILLLINVIICAENNGDYLSFVFLRVGKRMSPLLTGVE